jgi:hypothetical protein
VPVPFPGAERLDELIELTGQARELALGDRLDTELRHGLLDAPRGDAGQVEIGDNADQCFLRAAATLEQPVREVAALP